MEVATTIREALLNSLQKAFEEQVSKVPQAALRLLLERKLRDAGANLPPEGIDAMAQHLLAGQADSFSWDDGSDDEIDLGTLSFDDEDFAELQRIVSNVTDGLPEMVQSVAQKSAADLFKTLKTNWEVEGAIQAYETEEFKERLEERWGEALNLLRMLLTCCRELGEETFKRYRRSKSKRHQHRRFVLTRLHVRACQVADEIITLMENGFADGAMARWRTLYEIGVIVTLIETGDEDLAERYILHDTVDFKREADEHDRTQVPLGYPPIAASVRNGIDRDYIAALARFGDEFKEAYGWAAKRIKGKPTLKSLQEEAGRTNMAPYYKLASYNVHVGARSLFHRLSDLHGTGTPMAGRSNAGLVEPGQNTAFTLTAITSSLILDVSKIDRIIEMQALVEMRDAIPKALAKADRKLRRDDAAFRKLMAQPKRRSRAPAKS